MKVRQAFPAMRIFVFGQEVTEDAQSCTMSGADNTRAPSTASFTLVNKPTGVRSALDSGSTKRYTVEVSDMLKLFPKLQSVDFNEPYSYGAVRSVGEYQELVGLYDAFEERVGRELDRARGEITDSLAAIPDLIKRRVLTAKSGKTTRVSTPRLAGLNTSISAFSDLAALVGQAPKWNFWVGAPIFHSNDPVRIFVRDLFDARKWYFAFSGFITDWSVTRGVDGEEHIRFTCEDVLRILRYARVSTSPGLYDIEAVKEAEDFVVQTFFGSDFTGITLKELTYLLFFGPNTEYLDKYVSQGNIDASYARQIRRKANAGEFKKYTRYAANGESTTVDIPLHGIGGFSQTNSRVYEYGPASTSSGEAATPETVLADYHARTSSLVTVDDLTRLALPNESVPELTDIEGVITEIGENPQRYPVDGGALLMLAPRSLGAGTNRDIIDRGFKGPETQTSWKSRLGILYDVFNRLEFSFYATPRGDIVAEMPLYDFDPKHFGTYASDLIVQGDDIMTTQQFFTDERVRTMVTSTYLVIKGYTELGVAQRVAGEEPAVARRRTLVPQFGVRVEERNPEVYVSSKSGAEVYAELQLNKINADALTNSLQMIPRMTWLPNRPVFVEPERYIATLRSYSTTIDWASLNVSQNITMNYARPWQGDYADGEEVYHTLGGQGRAMNYAALFGED